jgi:hypothetical protein
MAAVGYMIHGNGTPHFYEIAVVGRLDSLAACDSQQSGYCGCARTELGWRFHMFDSTKVDESGHDNGLNARWQADLQFSSDPAIFQKTPAK